MSRIPQYLVLINLSRETYKAVSSRSAWMYVYACGGNGASQQPANSGPNGVGSTIGQLENVGMVSNQLDTNHVLSDE